MGHSIQGLLVKEKYDQKKAEAYDLKGIDLGFGITFFPITHAYSAYWQKKMDLCGFLEGSSPKNVILPSEIVLYVLLKDITNTPNPLFALIATDYFGGVGSQWAYVYRGKTLVQPLIPNTINAALKFLGVTPQKNQDAFNTVGLQHHRHKPEYLEKYDDMAEASGV